MLSPQSKVKVLLSHQRLPAVNYYHRALILDVAAVLDPPLVMQSPALKSSLSESISEDIFELELEL